MKELKPVLVCICITALFAMWCMPAFAEFTGFSSSEVDSESQEQIMNNVQFKVLAAPKGKGGIICFDINQDGDIAIGFSNNVIQVYSTAGELQNVYTFQTSGTYRIEWDGKYLNLCLVRSNLVLSYNRAGECQKIIEIPDTIENNSYWNHLINGTQKQMGGDTYTLENRPVLGFLATTYSRLVKVDSAGNRTIFFDDHEDVQRALLRFCFIAFFVFAGVFIIVKTAKAKKT